MRTLTACCLLCLAACASAPPPVCDYPELSREEVMAIIKDQVRATGGSTAMIDDGSVRPTIANEGCAYLVRLSFPRPRGGTWATYSVTRDGRATRVFRD
jgi:hypothetical protein